MIKKNNENLRIVTTILFVVIFSFVLIFLALNEMEKHQSSTILEDNFYSQTFDSKLKKIYLIGSSHTHRINATFVENKIAEQKNGYVVYNLATKSDRPEQRIKTLDLIISSNPEIVVYGIGPRDFRIFESETLDYRVKAILPEPPNFSDISYSLYILTDLDFEIFNSGQILTRNFIREPFVEKEKIDFSTDNLSFQSNTPFYAYDLELMGPIPTESEQQKYFKKYITWNGINDPETSTTFRKLIKIIIELQKNDVEVILFTTPYPRMGLDIIGDSDLETFVEITNKISESTGVQVYYLHDKYADLPIFNTGNHVAYNKTGIIFSENISKIILNEIG